MCLSLVQTNMTTPVSSHVTDAVGEATLVADPGSRVEHVPERSRVIVVDDDDAIREMMAVVLAQADYEVMTARDGEEALHLMTSFPPDLVISDLRMPRMSGFELLRIMRGRYPAIPVIAMSSEFGGDALPTGVIADVFLSKDCCTTPRFCATIAELLSVAPMRAAANHSGGKDRHEPGHYIDEDADIISVLGRLARSTASFSERSSAFASSCE